MRCRIFFVLWLLNSVAVVTKGAFRLRVSRKDRSEVGEGKCDLREGFLECHVSLILSQQSDLEDHLVLEKERDIITWFVPGPVASV